MITLLKCHRKASGLQGRLQLFSGRNWVFKNQSRYDSALRLEGRRGCSDNNKKKKILHWQNKKKFVEGQKTTVSVLHLFQFCHFLGSRWTETLMRPFRIKDSNHHNWRREVLPVKQTSSEGAGEFFMAVLFYFGVNHVKLTSQVELVVFQFALTHRRTHAAVQKWENTSFIGNQRVFSYDYRNRNMCFLHSPPPLSSPAAPSAAKNDALKFSFCTSVHSGSRFMERARCFSPAVWVLFMSFAHKRVPQRWCPVSISPQLGVGLKQETQSSMSRSSKNICHVT